MNPPLLRGPRAQLAVAPVAALLVIATQLATLQAWELLGRPLWLDEVHTLLLASRGSAVESVRDLAAGADFNPPTLFLLYRLVALPFGGLSEAGMRIFAVLSVAASLGVVYTILRSRFGRLEAVAGTLAVWAHPVVVSVAFEARFYGPLLLFSACFILLLARVRAAENVGGVLAPIGLAAIAVLLCTIHYFGVLSWLAAIAQLAVLDGREFFRRARRYAPALAGPVALAACIPAFLGQRRALSVATWIPEPTLGQVLFLVAIFFATPVVLVGVLLFGLRSWRRERGRPSSDQTAPAAPPPTTRSGGALRSSAGPLLLIGQAAVPLFLAAFSLVVQPATQQRYWIAGVLAIGAVVAYVASRAGPPAGLLLVASSLVMSWLIMRGEQLLALRFAQHVRADLGYVTGPATRSGESVVVRRRHSLYPLIAARPALADRLLLLDPAETTAGGRVHATDGSRAVRRFEIAERDVARAHERIYGFPTVVGRGDLMARQSFYLLEYSDTLAPSPAEFPRHAIQNVAPRLYLLRASDR